MADYRHARDIPDAVFLAAVEKARGDHYSSTRWNVAVVLGALEPDGSIYEVARGAREGGSGEGKAADCPGIDDRLPVWLSWGFRVD